MGRLSPRLADADLPRYYERDYRAWLLGDPEITAEQFERGIRRGRHVEEFLAQAKALPDPGARVIEIGAGPGGILASFSELGYRVAGSDLDRRCVEFARQRGIDLVQAEHVEQRSGEDPPGLVILSHLVEHLPDPIGTLREVRARSGPETQFFIEVPGLRSGRDRASEPQLPHFYYYDLTTLQWVCGQAGLELVFGDEEVRAVFHRSETTTVSTAANLERNLAALPPAG